MAAQKKEVDLLIQKSFEKTPVGKVLHWALTVGRWIVITTELIVILCFLSRFKLDRELMDLSETIKQQQAIVSSLEELETNFRNLQARLKNIKQFQDQQIPAAENLQQIAQITPVDVTLIGLEITQEGWEISALAISEASLHNFLKLLKETLNPENIILQEVIKKEAGGIEFTVLTSQAKKEVIKKDG